MGAVLDKVVGPDMVGVFRPKPDARPVGQPQPATFWLSRWDFQPLLPPDPLDALVIDLPSSPTEQRRHPAISIAAILAGQLDDVGGQRHLIVRRRRTLALRGTVLPQDPTDKALGLTQFSNNAIHAGAAAGGA
jgi:hypothetical protein